MASNDTRRIRGRLVDLVTDAVEANVGEAVVEVLTTGQPWRPKTDKVGVAVSFAGVKQNTVTLSGTGVTVEQGICIAQVVIPESHQSGNSCFDEAYRFAQAITTSVTVGARITVSETITSSATLNDPQTANSTITIMGNPTVVPGFEWRGNTHIPVEIPYEATTEG